MKYNVFPLDDRKAERFNPDLAGRPAVVRGKTQLLFPGMRRIQENAVINTKNKDHSVTAEIEVPASGGARGVIIAQGGNMGGWSLYAHEGKLKYWYNFLGVRQFGVSATEPLPAGKHQARMEFATRTREIAVRVALGASRRRVVGMVLFDVVKLVTPGIGIGLILTAALIRLNGENMGIPLSNVEYLAYVVGAAIAVLVAVCASLAPARRAASVPPMVAIRSE
jgi:hypothetical protein